MRRASLALLRTQSDDRLVALARAGSEQAFEAIVERYRRQLLRSARRLLSDASAEDAVQQAFLAAWTALRRGDEVRELPAWLHRIVHNVALNAIRGATHEAYAELPETLASRVRTDEEIERRMALRRTLAGVAALPERQREALLRTAVEGRSQEEVASALGLSHGAVAQLVMRGRRTLRAAATALTPPWLADWLGALGTAGGAGAGAITAGKVAAVVVVAGTAAAGPGLVDRDRPRQVAEATARERVVEERPRAERVPPAVAGSLPDRAVDASAPSAAAPRPRGSRRSGSKGSGSSGPGSSGPGSGGGADSSGPGSGGSGSSGPSESSGSGSSGSGDSGSSGSGSSGSGSSGSGSSGSGSSGSGSSGSGSSGSDSSGSGSGGSGTEAITGDSSGSGSSGSETLEPDSGGSGSGDGGSGSDGSDSSGSGSGDDSD